jgi:hypothetical protein
MATERTGRMTAKPGVDALAELTQTDRDELLRHPGCSWPHWARRATTWSTPPSASATRTLTCERPRQPDGSTSWRCSRADPLSGRLGRACCTSSTRRPPLSARRTGAPQTTIGPGHEPSGGSGGSRACERKMGGGHFSACGSVWWEPATWFLQQTGHPHVRRDVASAPWARLRREAAIADGR